MKKTKVLEQSFGALCIVGVITLINFLGHILSEGPINWPATSWSLIICIICIWSAVAINKKYKVIDNMKDEDSEMK